MMNATDNNPRQGIEAGLADLIRLRPDRNMTGFAPGGRVSTHQFGTNRSVFRGSGIEFDESRVYQAGDDVKAIDWRVTARTGTVHTKLFHEERERPVLVLVDCRSMMHFGSQVRFKSVLAAQVAALLCWVGIDGGDRVGGFLLDQSGMQSFPMTRNRTGMLTFLNGISSATRSHQADNSPTTEVPLQRALRQLRHASRPGTLVFIISDYADFDATAEAEMKRLAVRGHVTNILVYDRLDASLPARGDYRVSDGASVIALPGLGTTQWRDYQQAFHDRRQRLETLSRQRRMAFLALSTGDDPKTVLTPHRKDLRRQNQWGNAA
jgi:uncharacterized protein (DUF58 family)